MILSEENRMYPELTEAGKVEADNFLQGFRDNIKNALASAVEEVMSKAYTSCVPYIESDSWGNFRNEIMDGFKNYNNRKIMQDYDFAEIRKEIFKQFHDEIIPELNQDLVQENARLKETVKSLQETGRY
jgi:hypothetical protein